MTLLCILHACTLVLLIAVTNQFTHSDVVTPNDIHNLKEEVLKMQSFKHPNVMSLIGVCENFCGGPAVVMPFMANGSILDYLRCHWSGGTERGGEITPHNHNHPRASNLMLFITKPPRAALNSKGYKDSTTQPQEFPLLKSTSLIEGCSGGLIWQYN